MKDCIIVYTSKVEQELQDLYLVKFRRLNLIYKNIEDNIITVLDKHRNLRIAEFDQIYEEVEKMRHEAIEGGYFETWTTNIINIFGQKVFETQYSTIHFRLMRVFINNMPRAKEINND